MAGATKHPKPVEATIMRAFDPEVMMLPGHLSSSSSPDTSTIIPKKVTDHGSMTAPVSTLCTSV